MLLYNYSKGETQKQEVLKMSLFELFREVPDEMAEMVWRVYNSNNHGSLITEDYTKIPYPVLEELDDAPVVSCRIRTTKNARYVAVYVKF